MRDKNLYQLILQAIILFPGSRLKLNKGEVHSEKAGSEGVIFLSARPTV